ncbi:MAG TPA: GGDEF domain-containing protein [Candidatus Binataceae bacterium]|nr:GGDEF domain-containing protein [Candidatus Binataceae bacterium]
MEQKLLKALVVLDSRENSWFLSGGFHEPIDCRMIDVKSLRVNVEDLHGALSMINEQAPDVLLLDSTLPRNFVLKMIIQLHRNMPSLPMLLLPDIHGAAEHTDGWPAADVRLGSGADGVADGAPMAIDTIARTIRYTHGQFGLQRTLLQMALRDDLTGLHNRRGFTALATRYLKWARDAGQHMALFFADLDGLKSINDRFGHGEGDRAISRAAASIKATFRQFDVTARLSGDEFVALIVEIPGRSPEAICKRLQMNLADRSGAESRYELTVSVGVAHFDPDEPVTLQELMKQADSALYRHKRRDRWAPDGLAAPRLMAPESLTQTAMQTG